MCIKKHCVFLNAIRRLVVRVPLVVLAFIVPLLLSSLVTFSEIGEELRAAKHSSKVKSASSILFFPAQWDYEADESHYDDIDNAAFISSRSFTAFLNSGNDIASLRSVRFYAFSSTPIRAPPLRT
jgi:hypothetical protein